MPSPYESHNAPAPNAQEWEAKKVERNPKGWIWTCLILAGVSILYRVLLLETQEQTALMFIGLPTILAIALAMTPTAKSTTGRICKGMTMAFLMFGILAIEGFICILMAAPLFYLIGAIIGKVIDSKRSKNVYCSVVVVLGIMSIEGVNESLSFERAETITIQRDLEMSSDQVRQHLTQGPAFDLEQLPGFLQLGFPCPQNIKGNGIELGNTWTIHFAGGEGKPGDLVVQVTESTAERITLSCVSDQSHIAHWLSWKDITWNLDPTANDRTIVTMTINYNRDLDPAWYFKPIERYGVRKAGEYFCDQLFQ
ncbi:MAG: hypothetical protein ABGY95_10585 [Rubritalea sp.]|uniref:hypothetical protein n=1 Tax=Rubritalea sp. TaxID=2109375 RepID=UPI00324232FE